MTDQQHEEENLKRAERFAKFSADLKLKATQAFRFPSMYATLPVVHQRGMLRGQTSVETPLEEILDDMCELTPFNKEHFMPVLIGLKTLDELRAEIVEMYMNANADGLFDIEEGA